VGLFDGLLLSLLLVLAAKFSLGGVL